MCIISENTRNKQDNIGPGIGKKSSLKYEIKHSIHPNIIKKRVLSKIQQLMIILNKEIWLKVCLQRNIKY